jgi:hypothetical protein
VSVYVFVGPTLDVTEARTVLDAVYLPPVAQGDVYRAGTRHPEAIGIIDGYFERKPAVWHKEILWALKEGILVYGSASMGALRAAELNVFGMRGVGQIYEAFAAGQLEDDDEVAVSHAREEAGYRAQSEAMVNIRATLAAAEAEGIVTPGTRRTLEAIAKELFYPLRSFALVIRQARERGVPQGELDALGRWLPSGHQNLKRTDALAMLGRMRDELDQRPPALQPNFHFEHTKFWEAARRGAGELAGDDGAAASLPLERVLDELRVAGAFADVLEAATDRRLALAQTDPSGYEPEQAAVQAEADRFRRDRGLIGAADIANWMATHGLDTRGFARLIRDETYVHQMRRLAEGEALALVVDQLRLNGLYTSLVGRARDKQERLAALGTADVAAPDAGLDEPAVLAWYFAEVAKTAEPVDLDDFVAQLGLPNRAALGGLALREWAYRQGSAP